MNSLHSVTILGVAVLLSSKVIAECAGLYSQCGGSNWAGATCCSVGTCSQQNDYYYQCVSTDGSNMETSAAVINSSPSVSSINIVATSGPAVTSSCTFSSSSSANAVSIADTYETTLETAYVQSTTADDVVVSSSGLEKAAGVEDTTYGTFATSSSAISSTVTGSGTTTFPTATRTADTASTWDPPASLVTPLSQVWTHEMSTYSDPTGFKNYGFDQVMAHEGKINYCVRWETNSTKLTETYRAEIEAALQKQYSKWMDWLIGYDGFPYTSVPVSVVGWAVKSKDLVEGDTTGLNIYTDTDSDGIPQCSENCGRYFHTDNDYSSCAAGSDQHYDHSLWLTEGMDGGAGGDWGQRIGLEYFIDAVEAGTENIHIYLHELGHTYALDDFYDWMPDGVTEFIMNSGSSTVITDFDGWMFRDWWTNLKSRYDLS